jgi:hypothetical protein
MNIFTITKRLTPLFNTAELEQELGNKTRNALNLDGGLWRPLETLLLKGIPVKIKHHLKNGICEIETPAYAAQTPLYTHTKFLKEAPEPFKEWKKPPLPSLPLFLSRVNWCLKTRVPYLWGGNAPAGTRSLYDLYPSKLPLQQLEKSFKKIWTLQGVDCSGLIYWAAKGATGRNTSDLIREGTGVAIEGLSPEQIALKLRPGMILVWKGHVLLVTQEGIVDSTPDKGVSFTPTSAKLNELRNSRIPINEWPSEGNPPHPSFVVRDLYTQTALLHNHLNLPQR